MGIPDPARYFAYLFVALIAASLKVEVPGTAGTISVNFLFILIGIAQMSLAETLSFGCAATVVQCLWRAPVRPRPVQVLFNVSSMAVAITCSYGVYHGFSLMLGPDGWPVFLLLAAAVFFVANTVPIAAVISFTENKRLRTVWRGCYFWSFPYYLVGGALAGLLSIASHYAGWQASFLALPVLYIICRSYRLYITRLESDKRHAEEITTLHVQTIEALALAIEAKDCTTHAHLRRVQVYALHIGKDLGLSEPELQALRAAAVLHDIGKLAIPEHIISKPGRLTPEEYERIKIHPVVGAEILSRVNFPYPVVPIVRAHHERWDGSGYPDGLKEGGIPIGARILAAVDCFDALTSDRQYRRALPFQEAIRRVAAEAGVSFDPRVVEAIQRRSADLKRLAHAAKDGACPVPTSRQIERGLEPAAGFEHPLEALAGRAQDSEPDFVASVAAARDEVHALFEVAHDLGASLSLDETLSLLAVRLKRMISYDCIAIYVRRGGRLIPEYVNGEDCRLFASLEIPIGTGLSGWVAENRQPILNGNPAVESINLSSALRSAIAVPLEGVSSLVGVLALYHSDQDAFTRDHVRILLAISGKVALSIESAQRSHPAASPLTSDPLTGLPNARALFLHLDSEVMRAKRGNQELAVLLCDFDAFKRVNDRFGHLAGDRVLREVARTMRAACREYDYAARMGGDEFVLVLPGIRPEGLRNVIQRLRQATAKAARPVCGEELLTLSVGEAFFPQDGGNAEQLLAHADRSMHRVKQWQKLVFNADDNMARLDWLPTAVQ